MKKSRIILIILSVLFIAALFSAIPVSAASEGSENLADVIFGKKPLMNPEYIDGGKGFGWENSDKESSPSLFVYDEDDEDNPKYCMNINLEEQPEHGGAYWAEWKYDKAYSINRIVFRTGGDSEQSPRRMGDGYTISGSNDGSSWDVIYTGKEMDTEAENDLYYYIDIDASAAYQFFRLHSDKAGVPKDDGENDRDLIQYSMLILCSDDAPAYIPPWKPVNYKVGDDKTVIKAIDFDAGADNYNKNPNGDSKTMRPDEDVNTEVGESEFGGNIGWINAGEWVQYTVRFDNDGKYSFAAWLASEADAPGGVKVYCDDIEVGTSENAAKTKWQDYALYTAGEAEITAGSHVIKVEFTGGCNYSALEVVKTGDIEKTDAEPPAAVEENNANDGEANENENAAGDDNANNNGDKKDDDKEGGNILIPIAIGAVLVVIVIILVLATRKKKPDGGK